MFLSIAIPLSGIATYLLLFLKKCKVAIV